jgi:DNA-3-methyladenine glycosylase II
VAPPLTAARREGLRAVKPEYWSEAKAALSKRDAKLRKIIRKHPEDAYLTTRGDPFQTLARSIVGQQISVKAAQSIWDRFHAAAGGMKPPLVLALAEERLRECGLSRAKASYLRDLALHFDSGQVKPRRWPRMDDEAIIEELVQVRGIGRWSAEMFLIFHLLRPDVLPVADLGLQRAMELHYRDGEPLTRDEMRAIGAAWKPWSSVATWYLWRSLDPVAVEY